MQPSADWYSAFIHYLWAQVDTKGAKDIIQAAYSAGINFFDNAEAYAYGKSEEIMGAALRELQLPRHNIVISTKIFHGSSKDPAPTARGLSRKHIIEGVQGKWIPEVVVLFKISLSLSLSLSLSVQPWSFKSKGCHCTLNIHCT